MKAGDIVWVFFPYDGRNADKPHPALVLDVESNGLVNVAYGSSKHVDLSCPRHNEVVVSEREDLKQCGLVVPTRFDLNVRTKMTVQEHRRIGALPQRKYKQLFRAAVHCGLVPA